MCPNCGAIYHLLDHPPAKDGVCDKCGAQLVQRDDDKPETVEARLERQWTPEDLLTYYREEDKLVDIDGAQPLGRVTQALIERVKAQKGSA